jgi:hypothetical protein
MKKLSNYPFKLHSHVYNIYLRLHITNTVLIVASLIYTYSWITYVGIYRRNLKWARLDGLYLGVFRNPAVYTEYSKIRSKALYID